jgi:hypothetical protein
MEFLRAIGDINRWNGQFGRRRRNGERGIIVNLLSNNSGANERLVGILNGYRRDESPHRKLFVREDGRERH